MKVKSYFYLTPRVSALKSLDPFFLIKDKVLGKCRSSVCCSFIPEAQNAVNQKNTRL
jgi:hypothetical protein